MTLTLYTIPGACSLIPHILLRHLNIPFNLVPLKKGPDGYEPTVSGHTRADLLRANPQGYVPTLILEDGTTSITEVPAVLHYIAEIGQAPQLLGRNALERARVAEWEAWLSVTVHTHGFTGSWLQKRFSYDESAWPAIRTKGWDILMEGLNRVEGKIVSPWALGEEMTIVDFHLYIFWRWTGQSKIDRSAFGKWREIVRRVEESEGGKEALRVEGLQAVAEEG